MSKISKLMSKFVNVMRACLEYCRLFFPDIVYNVFFALLGDYDDPQILHAYIHFILLKQDNKHSRTHLSELDGKVHSTFTTAHENMKKIQNKRKKSTT